MRKCCGCTPDCANSIKPMRANASMPCSMDVGIGKRGRDRVKQYSKGMQQRLGLACALLHDPKLLFLDEPALRARPHRPVRGTQHAAAAAQGRQNDFSQLSLAGRCRDGMRPCRIVEDRRILTQGSVRDVLQEKTRWTLRVGGYAAG